tara:strand:+ start:60 stop:797 length:738 start_codon:yes stop_codon:yes gene_type:complete
MKKLLITFGALIILTSCGYSSESECLLKEMQKCDDATTCENQAYRYCSDEFPSKKTWDIYKKAPKSWVNIEVDSYRLTIKANQHRYEKVEVCLKKNWSLGKGRCGKISLNQYTQYRNGMKWTETDSDRDYFYDFINLDGDGLKENTKVVVTKAVEVGFFRYYVVGTLFLILKILAVGFVITIFVMFFNGELKTEDEVEVEVEEIEEVEQSNRFLILVPYLLIGGVIGWLGAEYILIPLLSFFGLW